jgi:hypothetical protein
MSRADGLDAGKNVSRTNGPGKSAHRTDGLNARKTVNRADGPGTGEAA